ncbi:two-component system, OmpR family, phosphate regulon sensor histidine kinase PhoR [Saccharicrinis carchari]|uniref:histidine kinase n=2 Tax=Saccharicrinis carchari TaxID=1168039 RepID=A0A521B191_SACCC|nr:two-component system, OmpR family, phosphate regulon sensor histidine kinase PhoR [Saccharicrinis carchari]
MGFSLLGIITVQFFWMNNAIKVRKEKFDATVYDALQATVHRAQRERAASHFIERLIPSPYAQNIATDTLPRELPYFPDASPRQNRYSPGDIEKDKNPTVPYRSSHVEGYIEIQRNGKSQQVIISEHNFNFEDNKQTNRAEQLIRQWQDSLKQVLSKGGNINPLSILNQFSYEIEMRSSDVSNRIDTKNLTRILNYELKARGIDLGYEYAVINRNNGAISKLVSNNYKKEKSNFSFVVNLFPDDFFRNWTPMALDVYFPKEDIFIYKSLHLLLGSSFIFTLFILITFYFTLRTILNQKKLSEIKSDFISNMTHEFKTPIATINLATDNIANPMIIDKPAHISPFLKIIKEENKRMNNQVERVLQMSLIEKKDFQVVRVKTDLHALINDAVGNMQLLAEQKQAQIITKLQAQRTILKVDEVHFTNVIMNLVENALKYSKENPVIELTTQNSKTGIEINVIDNGIGMTKEQQNKVFDKFFRATRGNIHNVKGFGLGLSYVKAIVDEHKGSIIVKSKPGEGSTFKLLLPYA